MGAASSDYFGATKTREHLGEVQSEVVRFEVRFPTDKEQSSLLIDADAPVYDFVRLRLLNGEPVSLDLTVMPVGLVPGLNKAIWKARCFAISRDAGAEADGILPRGAGDEAG